MEHNVFTSKEKLAPFPFPTSHERQLHGLRVLFMKTKLGFHGSIEQLVNFHNNRTILVKVRCSGEKERVERFHRESFKIVERFLR